MGEAMQLGASSRLGNGFIRMTPAAPQTLLENAGLAFLGEQSWTPAVVTAAEARALATARNPTGRPNHDVLRRLTGVKSGRPHEPWQIDFPPHYTEQEAALYLEPCRQLRSQRQDSTVRWWLNPSAQPELRTALARLERFLATPLAAAVPTWDWIDSNLLPDDSLLVAARDDDFVHGLLGSRLFQVWWREHRLHVSPPTVVASFPFPWSPGTLLSSLSRLQEEQRLALARAARGADPEQIHRAAAAAYGWPLDLPDEELLAHLTDLNHSRSLAGL